MIDEGWFGPIVTDAARERYGDVALVAKGTAAFTEPTDTGPYHLVGRHGSATPAELDVPLLVATAEGRRIGPAQAAASHSAGDLDDATVDPADVAA